MENLFKPEFQQIQTYPNSEYVPLPSLEDIEKSKRQADKKIHSLSDDVIKELRIRCKYDLAFFIHGPLGYNKLDPEFHGKVCLWIQETKYDQFTLLLLPRSHYKSTVDTISETAQCALPDDLGNLKYPYNLGPNVRQCIVHDVTDMAQLFLRSIVQQFTMNPLLMGLFPECVPDPRIQKINIKEMCLPRSEYWNESTFDTMGMNTKGQGRHYNRMKLDDIYGEASVDSEAERNAHIQTFDNIQSYLITPARDQLRIRGTRWAFDDVYAHAMKVYGSKLKTYIKSVYVRDERGKFLRDPKTNLRIPEFKWDEERESGNTNDGLDILEANKRVWNAQYINDPSEGSTEFDESWKRYYEVEGRYLKLSTQKTPFNAAEYEYIAIEELDICVLCDPALSENPKKDDPTGLVVTGMDRNERVFVLECFKNHIKSEDLCNFIFQLFYKWHFRILAMEEVNFSKLYQNWFRSEMRIRGVKFNIVGIKTGQTEKKTRVKALTAWYSSFSIYFKRVNAPARNKKDQYHLDLEKEYDEFGASDDYHMHDALCQGCRDYTINGHDVRVWKKGGNVNNIGTRMAQSLNNRDVITGYSQIR